MMQNERGSSVLQESDRIHARPVALILLAAVVVACALVSWGWLELRAGERAAYPEGLPGDEREEAAQAGRAGIIQTLINVDTSVSMSATNARAILQSYGWVDSAQGIARIPIDQAMRAIVERSRP